MPQPAQGWGCCTAIGMPTVIEVSADAAGHGRLGRPAGGAIARVGAQVMIAAIVMLLAHSQATAARLYPLQIREQLDRRFDLDYPQLEALYEDIHAHPELGFQEHRTAALLASRMRRLGFAVTEGVGRTGIVAVYHNGPGPVVLVRTELDALPMKEETALPYRSQVQERLDGRITDVAHSCGHDIHMAWWVGTAQGLLALKSMWHGTLVFVGQPAEEEISGAKAMLADGLFSRFPRPEYGFAAHVGPALAGTVVVKQGVVSSASDAMTITFRGRGAHGAMPDKSIDPIIEGSHFVDDVQTVISREKDPQRFGVVTVGAFNAGYAGNIIPDRADLQLTLRSFDADVRQLLIRGVTDTAVAVAQMARAPAPLVQHPRGTGSVVNDSVLAASAAAVVAAALGQQNVTLVPASAPGGSASEDYSEYGAAGLKKSVYFSLGGYTQATLDRYQRAGKPVPANHSPEFAPDPRSSIRAGVETLALAVMLVAQISAPIS